MSDRLYPLLPEVVRVRDYGVGEPMRALLQVVGEQVDVVEDDLARLYANWFVETCDEWVLPYLGDLIGHRPGHGVLPGAALRRDVANTIRARRRKGTLALLEELAADVGGWPARAVEMYRLLGVAAPVRLLDPRTLRVWRERGHTVDVRAGDALAELDGPFDELAHTVTVGRARSRRTRRLFGIPTVALFVWRLRPHAVTDAPAFCIDRARNHYTFSVLGNDVPLVTRPVAEPDPTHVADETNVPGFIGRRAFDARTPDFYGPGASLFVWRDAERTPVPLASVVPADLSRWAYRPTGAEVAVDPVLGRIAFARAVAPESGVRVTYHHGFPADIGGGEYPRPLPAPKGKVYPVGEGAPHRSPGAAIAAWRAEPDVGSAVVEIVDNAVYEEPLEIELGPGERLELRAAQHHRPVIRLLNWSSSRPDSLRVRGGQPDAEPATLVLDGLLVTGRGLRVSGNVGRVELRHCTLVPGWSLGDDCEPAAGGEPSVELADDVTALVVRHSILGPVRVDTREPAEIRLTDSILDATDADADALFGADGHACAVVRIERSTVFGSLCVREISLAEDSIFTGCVRVARRQAGCVRFCHVPVGSRTPRRFQCQPDVVRAAVVREVPESERGPRQERETRRVRPQFTAVRYGTPAYAQLTAQTAVEIRTGAHDQSEMGAYHDLFAPQRETALLAHLDEHTPAETDVALVHVT